MTLSGACALAAGFAFGHPLALLVPLLFVWGITVVADSAQFSAAVSELAPRELVGTALTLQTSLGFLLTCLTIYLLPWVAARIGWRWSMSLLALGPAGGGWGVLTLRPRPEAAALARGGGVGAGTNPPSPPHTSPGCGVPPRAGPPPPPLPPLSP